MSTMMFDIIACSESRHQGNEGLQRYALGRRRYMKNTCVCELERDKCNSEGG